MIDVKELRRKAEEGVFIHLTQNQIIELLDEIDRLKAGGDSSHKHYVEAVTR